MTDLVDLALTQGFIDGSRQDYVLETTRAMDTRITARTINYTQFSISLAIDVTTTRVFFDEEMLGRE